MISLFLRDDGEIRETQRSMATDGPASSEQCYPAPFEENRVTTVDLLTPREKLSRTQVAKG